MKSSLLLALCLPLAACNVHVGTDEKSGEVREINISVTGENELAGNGKHASQTRTVGAVKEVEATGRVDVQIRIGATPSLTVEGDENLLAEVVTEQAGDKLIIRNKRSFSSKGPLKVILVTPAVAVLRSTGSGDISVEGLAGGDLKLESTGSGDIKLAGQLGLLTARLVGSGDLQSETLKPANITLDLLGAGEVTMGSVDVDRFEANLKGSGTITASGTAKTLVGSVLGSGDLQLEQLHAHTAELQLMGSGDIIAYASTSVTAAAMGSGEIIIHGKPAKQQLSGDNASLAS
ncbi:head GIN domain-containing protein [Chitinimonas arctica]|nr:head GIN domain-containing protein [Chitinimonas arctica]